MGSTAAPMQVLARPVRLYTGTFSTHCESESIFLKNTFSALFFAVPKINGIFAPSNQKQDGPNIQYG
jgi:hypothetical protein